MAPSKHQAGEDSRGEFRIVRGIRREERARRVLGTINREGVGGRRKEAVVEKVGELSE